LRKRAVLLTVFWVLLFSSAALAADLNGKWVGTMSGPDGQGFETTFVFKVDGEKLSGTMANQFGEDAISEGTVKGDDVSFVVLAGGGSFKLNFTGKISGDELKLSIAMAEMGNTELTAKRVQ
jgi:hypothetical protein